MPFPMPFPIVSSPMKDIIDESIILIGMPRSTIVIVHGMNSNGAIIQSSAVNPPFNEEIIAAITLFPN